MFANSAESLKVKLESRFSAYFVWCQWKVTLRKKRRRKKKNIKNFEEHDQYLNTVLNLTVIKWGKCDKNISFYGFLVF